MAARNPIRTKVSGSDLHERLCRARKFIDDSYHLPLNLAEISKEACLSPYHFRSYRVSRSHIWRPRQRSICRPKFYCEIGESGSLNQSAVNVIIYALWL